MIFAQPRFNQFCLSVYCVVGLFVAVQAKVCAHVYEDGFVERSLTITIRDGVGYGEYRIGLNSKTALQFLNSAEQKRKDYLQSLDLKPHRVAPEGLLRAPDSIVLPKKLKANEPDKKAKLKLKSDARSETYPKDSSKNNLDAKPSSQEAATVGSGEHLTDLQTIERFGDLRDHWFTNYFKLSGDGQPIKLSKVSVEPAARHPYSVMVKFQFSLDRRKEPAKPVVKKLSGEIKSDPQISRTIDFRVADSLFAEYSGATRYALRTRGSTILLQSNVASVLVRADRVEIKKNTTVGEENLPTIRAKMTVSE